MDEALAALSIVGMVGMLVVIVRSWSVHISTGRRPSRATAILGAAFGLLGFLSALVRSFLP